MDMLNTRRDFEKCLKDIIDPIKRFYTRGSAGLDLGGGGVNYGRDIALMEGFSRILWGLAPFFAGGSRDPDFEKIYLDGIISGTDPSSEEYWGIADDEDQRLVEMAAIGLGIILAPDKLWAPLSEAEKRNFYNWLSQINSLKSCANNWQMFPVLVNLGFKTVGMPYDKEVVERSLERIESYYRGDGWYTDGNTDQIDYYIAFAIHFYSLIYAKVMEDEDKTRSLIFKERAREFIKDFIYYFADDGSALAFGRSLTYRFAQCCFFSACVFAGVEALPLGVMKGIITRNIEWWLSKPIFHNAGALSVGYAYPNLCMSEFYNSSTSPYWALKSFLVLALPEDHPFFKVEPSPLPPLDELHIIKHANMVIQRMNGSVYAITAGQYASWGPTHTAEKYSKFLYSSEHAFSVPRSYCDIAAAAPDNMLAFERDNMIFVRRRCLDYRINDDGSVYSLWSPFAGVTVETTVSPTERGSVRRHTVVSDGEYVAYDTSLALARGGDGIVGGGEPVVINAMANTSLMYPKTEIKAMKYTIPQGKTQIVTEFIYPEVDKETK
jgi:hypothetical protein